MGAVIELFFFMFIIATAAFAPLGYFIYKYTIYLTSLIWHVFG